MTLNPAPASPSRAFDVLGVGTNSVDLVYDLPAFPRPDGLGSKMRVSRHSVSCGGQTATAMTGCARLGLRAAYVGVTGSDAHGQRLRTELAARGVDVDHVLVRDVPNRFAVILLHHASGERAVLWDRDERLALGEADLPPRLLRSARLVHVDDEEQDAAIRTARAATEAGLPVTSDLDRMTERTEELVLAVTHAIFAEGLPAQLTGIDDHERALRKLRLRHAGLLCVTLGKLGAVALDGDKFIVSPGFAVDAVDTTGAGDLFRSALIYGLLQAWPLDRTLRFANAAAAVSCTRHGAMDSAASLEEALAMAR